MRRKGGLGEETRKTWQGVHRWGREKSYGEWKSEEVTITKSKSVQCLESSSPVPRYVEGWEVDLFDCV